MVVGNMPSEFPVYDCSMCNKAIPTCRIRRITFWYDELIEQAGTDADGMVISQVVPPYYLTDLKTVALYRRMMLKYAPSSRPTL